MAQRKVGGMASPSSNKAISTFRNFQTSITAVTTLWGKKKEEEVSISRQNTPFSLGKEAIICDIQDYFYLHS